MVLNLLTKDVVWVIIYIIYLRQHRTTIVCQMEVRFFVRATKNDAGILTYFKEFLVVMTKNMQ